MYVPSERNLLTVLENTERINRLPVMLSIFLDEYNKAKKKMNGDVYNLPVSGVRIELNPLCGNLFLLFLTTTPVFLTSLFSSYIALL